PKAFVGWDSMFQVEQAGKSIRDDSGSLTISGQASRLNEFSREVYGWLAPGFSAATSGVSAKGGNRAEAPLLDLVRTGIENDFESVVFPKYPAIREVKRALERSGARYVSLSGSGSAVYGLFSDQECAAAAAKSLNDNDIPAQATMTLPRTEYWKEIFPAKGNGASADRII
ncbi:MAG: 4-(cytidine 5'-diphospho)-2-C-methyl-D-erythritol kinase, partial [Candidatus Angelobacter sp.]